MKITEMISITELSRLLKKSRPTVYKYVSDFENGQEGNVPHSVRKLFRQIQSGDIPKREIYAYCDDWFVGDYTTESTVKKRIGLKEVIKLLKEHENKIDFEKLKKYIDEEIRK